MKEMILLSLFLPLNLPYTKQWFLSLLFHKHFSYAYSCLYILHIWSKEYYGYFWLLILHTQTLQSSFILKKFITSTGFCPPTSGKNSSFSAMMCGLLSRKKMGLCFCAPMCLRTSMASWGLSMVCSLAGPGNLTSISFIRLCFMWCFFCQLEGRLC